jgi:hypothetical protein
MALWFRVTLAIWLVLIAALSLSLFLNLAKFDTTYSELARSRFQVLAQDLRNSVESGLELGLGLGELRTTQEIVMRAKSGAPEIRWVVVADIRGAVLFDSEGNREERSLTPVEVAAITAVGGGDRVWSAQRGDDIVIGLPILNPFQVPVGVIELRYDAGGMAAIREKALRDMLGAMVAIVAVLTVVTIPLVTWAFGGVRRTFAKMLATAIATLPPEALNRDAAPVGVSDGGDAPAEGSQGQAENPAAKPSAGDTLEAEFGAFARSAAGTLDRLRSGQSR